MNSKQSSTEGSLPFWTVYNNPSDYPGKWVARKFSIGRDGVRVTGVEPDIIEESLEAVMAKLPPGLYPLGRSQGDDPVIVGCWV